jgi:hypothetical protein
VEVHQDSTNSTDNVFGLELYAASSSSGAGQLQINLSNTLVIISWPGTGTLQSAASLDSSSAWADLTTNSPYSTLPMSTNRFYRLRISP